MNLILSFLGCFNAFHLCIIMFASFCIKNLLQLSLEQLLISSWLDLELEEKFQMQYSLGIEMHPKGQDVARYASIQLNTSTGSLLSFIWSKCLSIGIGSLHISLPEILQSLEKSLCIPWWDAARPWRVTFPFWFLMLCLSGLGKVTDVLE